MKVTLHNGCKVRLDFILDTAKNWAMAQNYDKAQITKMQNDMKSGTRHHLLDVLESHFEFLTIERTRDSECCDKRINDEN